MALLVDLGLYANVRRCCREKDEMIVLFRSFMRAHAQAMNEYRGGEMSTEVVVDRNLWTEIVDRRRK